MGAIGRTPYLGERAATVSGALAGRTIKTEVLAETSDDQLSSLRPRGCGPRQPFLVAQAVLVAAELRGRTVITRAPETTDD